MTEERRDETLREAFEELRSADQATAPAFEGIWGRPAPARRSPLLWLVPAGAAAAVLLVVLSIGLGTSVRHAPSAPPAAVDAEPLLAGVVEPEPLAFLLERPREVAP